MGRASIAGMRRGELYRCFAVEGGLIHVYRIYLPELQRLSIITKCNIMFLKSIKHVHKLSPSGREREKASTCEVYIIIVFYRGKMQGYEVLSN